MHTSKTVRAERTGKKGFFIAACPFCAADSVLTGKPSAGMRKITPGCAHAVSQFISTLDVKFRFLPKQVEVTDLPRLGPVVIELGEENVYFTDAAGRVYFLKQDEIIAYRGIQEQEEPVSRSLEEACRNHAVYHLTPPSD